MADRMLGEYSVRRRLGRGGMGEVWEGLDPDLDRPVAIKVILPHLSADPTFSERLRGEAKLVAALRHPNIVQLYDFDIVEGQAIMVMEYLAGGSLRERLTRLSDAGQRMPLATAVKLLEAVAAGLDYAHARGAVHRDLKPGNILFTDADEPIISDFGIAKIVNASSNLKSPTIAGPSSILGTPAYMSPEQAGGGEIDHRSDLYSLGIVLYELVTGRVPFMGESPAAILTQQLQHLPPTPRTFNPNLPEAVEEVVLRALAKEPAARFSKATEMMQALRSAAEHLERIAPNHSTATQDIPNQINQMDRADPANVMIVPPPPTPPAPTPPAPTPTQDPPTIATQPEHPTIVDARKGGSSQAKRASPRDAGSLA